MIVEKPPENSALLLLNNEFMVSWNHITDNYIKDCCKNSVMVVLL